METNIYKKKRNAISNVSMISMFAYFYFKNRKIRKILNSKIGKVIFVKRKNSIKMGCQAQSANSIERRPSLFLFCDLIVRRAS